MAESHYSAEAHKLVNEIAGRLVADHDYGRLRWESVALVLAEALIDADRDYNSLWMSEMAYCGVDGADTRIPERLAGVLAKIGEEAKRG